MFYVNMLNIRKNGFSGQLNSQISNIYHVHGCVFVVEKARKVKVALEYYNR